MIVHITPNQKSYLKTQEDTVICCQMKPGVVLSKIPSTSVSQPSTSFHDDTCCSMLGDLHESAFMNVI